MKANGNNLENVLEGKRKVAVHSGRVDAVPGALDRFRRLAYQHAQGSARRFAAQLSVIALAVRAPRSLDAPHVSACRPFQERQRPRCSYTLKGSRHSTPTPAQASGINTRFLASGDDFSRVTTTWPPPRASEIRR